MFKYMAPKILIMEHIVKKSFKNPFVLVGKKKYKDKRYKLKIPDPRMIKPYGIFIKKADLINFFQDCGKLTLGNDKLLYVLPNNIALSLNICHTNFREAKIIKKRLLKEKESNIFFKSNIKELYDYFEKIQISIVFMYQAIETFTNSCIPDEFQYEKKNHKGVKETYTKKEILRWITTSEKLSDIIPNVLSIESPKKHNFWSDFKQLEQIRNEIVHNNKDASNQLYSSLFDSKINKIIDAGLKLIKYFIHLDKYNKIFPFEFCGSTIPIFPISETDLKNINILNY